MFSYSEKFSLWFLTIDSVAFMQLFIMLLVSLCMRTYRTSYSNQSCNCKHVVCTVDRPRCRIAYLFGKLTVQQVLSMLQSLSSILLKENLSKRKNTKKLKIGSLTKLEQKSVSIQEFCSQNQWCELTQTAQGTWLQSTYQRVLTQVRAIWTCPKHIEAAHRIVYIGNV